ncbi:MAG: hypothetical protein IKZ90_04435 [Clostridiales bacterium]|nr:hypothetical protein [Clostridiales bacterium]
MKIIDIRLKQSEVDMLCSMIGKKLIALRHDEFQFTPTSSQVVEMVTENASYYLYSFTECLDYYGTKEDVAVWSISDDKLPIIDKKAFIKTPVNEVVKGITLIQENQRLFENGKQTYDVWVTRGIIFEVGDRQIAFEKDVWFSEEIVVHRGYELSKQFSPAGDFCEHWDSSVRAECSREEVDLKPID